MDLRLQHLREQHAAHRVGFYIAGGGPCSVAAFDFADLGEEILGFSAFIVLRSHCEAPAMRDEWAAAVVLAERCRCRFSGRVVELSPGQELEDAFKALHRSGVCLSHMYIPKYGHTAHPSLTRLMGGPSRLIVHAAFDGRTPHGDVYARLSDSASGSAPVVPPLTRLRRHDGADWRERLGIPSDATVFGRFGSYHGLDDPTTRTAILRVARLRPDSIFFLLVNTAPILAADDGSRGGSSTGSGSGGHRRTQLPSFIESPFSTKVAYEA